MISEKSLFHPHGPLRAGYAKCYFAHLLYFIQDNLDRTSEEPNDKDEMDIPDISEEIAVSKNVTSMLIARLYQSKMK